MKVAILYSGGKDSTYAVQHALEQGWNISYLLSVKPTRTDCFLFHYATVELTKEISKILNLKHIYTTCNVADPKKEALIVKDIVKENPVDAVVLGGTGLQKTQINSIREALNPLGIEVFAAHKNKDHEEVFKDMISKGYEIIITQVASDGLKKWLGRKITKDNFQDLKEDSEKYGFHIGGEGGYFDSLVVNAPFFNKKILISSIDIILEDEYSGHVVIKEKEILEKPKKLIN